MVVVLVGIGLNHWLSQWVDETMRGQLLNTATLIAESVSVNDIRQLSGTEEDLGKPQYVRLKERYAAARAMDANIRFVYLMGKNDAGEVFFFADNEPVGSEDESPAGQIYEEVDDVILAGFQSATPHVIGPVTDRWGTWVTALVPYVDQASGEVIALQGVDIDATHWRKDVLLGSLATVLG